MYFARFQRRRKTQPPIDEHVRAELDTLAAQLSRIVMCARTLGHLMPTTTIDDTSDNINNCLARVAAQNVVDGYDVKADDVTENLLQFVDLNDEWFVFF
jgi:hypothetical protein